MSLIWAIRTQDQFITRKVVGYYSEDMDFRVSTCSWRSGIACLVYFRFYDGERVDAYNNNSANYYNYTRLLFNES